MPLATLELVFLLMMSLFSFDPVFLEKGLYIRIPAEAAGDLGGFPMSLLFPPT